MVTNETNQVLIRHWNSNPAVMNVGEKVYRWIPQFNVSLAWVDEADVPAVLAVQASICCGRTQAKFWLANENDLSIWSTGHT